MNLFGWILGLIMIAPHVLRSQEDTLRWANYTYMLLDRQEDLMINSAYLHSNLSKRVHLGIRPYRYEMLDRMSWDKDTFDWSLAPFRRFALSPAISPESESLVKASRYDSPFLRWMHDKLFNESLLILSSPLGDTKEKYQIAINPILFQEVGGDGDNSFFLNTRGAWINGNFGKVSFYTMLADNVGRFPRRYNDLYRARKFAHGWGWYRGLSDGRQNFSTVMGEVNYTPNNYFSFTLGHGKHFWGDGYRSLFLSDFALPFPFFKIETSVGSIKYINLWAVHADGSGPLGLNAYPNKYTAMHLLSWNVTKRWNVQFFEANVWTGDTSIANQGFNVNFFNPVIFFRSIEYIAGFGGGNAILGVGTSYIPLNGWKVYGQFVLDDFQAEAFRQRRQGHWLNLYGFQAGVLHSGCKPNLNYTIGLEWNRVHPFVYAHRSTLTNYEHLNYPLAHPWGSGFQETLIHGQVRYKRWVGEMLLSTGVAGRDTSGVNLGNNIQRSYEDRPLGNLGYNMPTGNPVYISNVQLSVGYMVNISTGMRLEAGIRIRRARLTNPEPNTDTQPFNWFFVGLRTPFMNRYYDQ